VRQKARLSLRGARARRSTCRSTSMIRTLSRCRRMRSRGSGAWRDADTSRARLAASSRRQHPRDPRHLDPRASCGESRRSPIEFAGTRARGTERRGEGECPRLMRSEAAPRKAEGLLGRDHERSVGSGLGKTHSISRAAKLSDDGVEGWREQETETGHAQHPEQHGGT
jgi:hypothetical protein